MKPYIKNFIIASINDIEVSEAILIDYVAPMVNAEFGDVVEQKLNFIKPLLTITNPEHVSRIVVDVIDGDIEEFANIIGINIDNHDDIDKSREKWELTEFAPDFEELLTTIVESLTCTDDIEITTEYKFKGLEIKNEIKRVNY